MDYINTESEQSQARRIFKHAVLVIFPQIRETITYRHFLSKRLLEALHLELAFISHDSKDLTWFSHLSVL